MSTYNEIKHEYTTTEKQMYWDIGTGLQAVDGLEVSSYLKELKEEEIHGQITLEEVKESLRIYYELDKAYPREDSWEADFVSTRITEYLRESEFRLHPLA